MPAISGHGLFCWHDLMTTEPEEALPFYEGLFGWEVSRELELAPGAIYRVLRHAGGEFGGLGQLPPDSGIFPYWISYLQTDDVDATAAEALRLGGRQLVPPVDIPGMGRIAVLADRSGAGFALLDADLRSLVVVGRDAPAGAPAWNELITDDFAIATTFYTRLFGYQAVTGEETAFMTDRDGDMVKIATLRAQPATMPIAAWTVSFRVDDLDAARERVEELGGENPGLVQRLPAGDRAATVIDPTGAVFSIREAAGA